jgi:hypothetical protein
MPPNFVRLKFRATSNNNMVKSQTFEAGVALMTIFGPEMMYGDRSSKKMQLR